MPTRYQYATNEPRALFACYRAVADEKGQPQRNDFPIDRLLPFIGDLSLIRLMADGRHFVTLMGERTANQSYRDLTKRYVEDAYDGAHKDLVLAPFAVARREGKVVYERRETRDTGTLLMQRLVLPLFDAAGSVTEFMVGLWADSDAYPRRRLLTVHGEEPDSRLFKTDAAEFAVILSVWPVASPTAAAESKAA